VGGVLSETRKFHLPTFLGFREGTSSVHTSRTMMLGELSLVFEQVALHARADEYLSAIVEQNVLGKATQTTRKRTSQRLVELYALDQTRPVFRLLRHFWIADVSARPMLAYLAATARDPILREMTPVIVACLVDSDLNATQIANQLNEKYPSRFSPSTLLSTAQNLASSWTQAGYLAGKVNKKRTRAVVTPVVATFAFILGYLCGLRGRMLLDTIWTDFGVINRVGCSWNRSDNLAEVGTANGVIIAGGLKLVDQERWVDWTAAGNDRLHGAINLCVPLVVKVAL
jgi:hypothetical protein